MKFFGVFELDKIIHSGFYESWLDWHSDTFSPDTEVLLIIDFKVSGTNYTARKENVRDKARDFQSLFSLYGVSLSYSELAIFGDYFTTQGRRYGLLREFREAGIL